MRRALLLLIAILSLSLVMSGAQTTLFGPDGFTGTATNALHTYNAAYINSTLSNQWNDLLISTPNGFAVFNAGQSGAYITGQTWTDDQFAQFTLTTLPVAASAKVCIELHGSGGNNPDAGYCVGPDPNIGGVVWRLFDVVDGLLASSATNAVAGNVVNIEIIGTTITVRIGGTPLADLTTTDMTPYTGGNPGMYINDAVAKVTAFSAGSAGSAAATATRKGPLTGVLP